MTLDSLIYASVVLGALLLVQLYGLVPFWLFYSVLTGWVLYLAVAIAASIGREFAYPPALALSFVTLLVSLPQPEHYSLLAGGLTLAALTFILGSAVQVGVIVGCGMFLLMRRKRSRGRSASGLRTISSS